MAFIDGKRRQKKQSLSRERLQGKSMIRFTIPIEGVAKGRPRVTKTGTYTPTKTRRWEQTVALFAREAYDGPPIDCPIALKVNFVMRRPARLMRKKDPEGQLPCDRKPDLDNLCKSVKDGLSSILTNDSRVVKIEATKMYAEKSGLCRVEVELERWSP